MRFRVDFYLHHEDTESSHYEILDEVIADHEGIYEAISGVRYDIAYHVTDTGWEIPGTGVFKRFEINVIA